MKNPRTAAWIGLLAVVLNVFWPLIADGVTPTAPMSDAVEHTMQPGEGHCAEIPGGAPNNGHGSPHCAFCTLIADKAPIVFAASVPHSGVLIVDGVPYPSGLAPLRQSPFYRSAPPRAPPVLS